MSCVRPFRGFRPKASQVRDIASPPYDVLNSEEARELARGNPLSFLHVTKSEIDFEPGVDTYKDEIYKKGAQNLDQMIKEGILIQDPEPCFYIYEQRMGNHVQKGFVLGASVQEYEDGLIKKHELTRRDKEDDRARHVELLMANTGLVFLLYKHFEGLDNLLEDCSKGQPVYDFVAHDGIGHRFWIVESRETIKAIEEAFLALDALYIADGHHRSASGFRVRNNLRAKNPNHDGQELYNHFLAVVFPDNQLKILPYNRAVKDLNGLSKKEFLSKLEEKFHCQPSTIKSPEASRNFCMYLDGQWYALSPRAGTFDQNDPIGSLDVSILQNNLLAPILGIEDPRTDKRIDFIGGIRGTEELERRVSLDMALAFSMYPTRIDQLIAIADAGMIMPPKSTWFEPKLLDGVVVRSLKENF